MVDSVFPFLTKLEIIVDVSFHHYFFFGVKSRDFPLGIYHKDLIKRGKKQELYSI